MAIKNRRKIPKDLTIELTSNMNGTMSFVDTKSKTQAYIKFNNIDDTDTCNFEELKALLKQKPKFLEKAYIVITDVSSIEDEKFTVDDLLEHINLKELYRGSVNPQFLERFISTIKYEKFTTKIQDCSVNLIEVILERAVHMYKQGTLVDSMKMNYLQSLLPNVKLFR